MPAPVIPVTVIERIEDAIVARLKNAFGDHLKYAGPLAGELDDDTFKRIKANAPGAFVCLAAARPSSSGDPLVFDLQWGVYFVAKRLQSEGGTTRGTALQIGAYKLLSAGLKTLADAQIVYGDEETKLEFLDADNLFEDTMRDLGLFVYGLRFETKRVRVATAADDLAGLSPFQTFAGDWVVPPVPAGTPVPIPEPVPAGVNVAARDRVKLPQE